ncbi:hypothetical protein N781_04005 [Pontibacillus halophilus JSM 076056 = DSM 19796]|uniref:Uncharacterized protein n=1 Tax=Pontibacillus halophilus JSM 076056 = DSM 19796 TaxID=1385510 RepID=A0A0A5GEQ1_9BACI|nr:hypothetical protein [Pontibacillus halophilus]KGX91696.1 hypothetical protein N781_04005 [Pontibacillus halophilus JSM 076056 = DSM 19796]
MNKHPFKPTSVHENVWHQTPTQQYLYWSHNTSSEVVIQLAECHDELHLMTVTEAVLPKRFIAIQKQPQTTSEIIVDEDGDVELFLDPSIPHEQIEELKLLECYVSSFGQLTQHVSYRTIHEKKQALASIGVAHEA